jgi:hypothetical protein
MAAKTLRTARESSFHNRECLTHKLQRIAVPDHRYFSGKSCLHLIVDLERSFI